MGGLQALQRALENNGAPRVEERIGLQYKMAPQYDRKWTRSGAAVKEPTVSWDARLLGASGVEEWWQWVGELIELYSGSVERCLPVLPVAGIPLSREASEEVARSYQLFYALIVGQGSELAERLWPPQLVPLVALTGQVWAVDLNRPEHGTYLWWLEDTETDIERGFEAIDDLAWGYTSVLQSGLVEPAIGDVDPMLGMYWAITSKPVEESIIALRLRMDL